VEILERALEHNPGSDTLLLAMMEQIQTLDAPDQVDRCDNCVTPRPLVCDTCVALLPPGIGCTSAGYDGADLDARCTRPSGQV
jgi:hypothetical protein